MKTVVLVQGFPVPPAKVIKRYLDKRVYKDVLAEKVKIVAEPGGTLRIGDRRGEVLLLDKRRMVVHTIRYEGWDKSLPSVVATLLVLKKGEGATLRLCLVNVPDAEAERIKTDFKVVLDSMKAVIELRLKGTSPAASPDSEGSPEASETASPDGSPVPPDAVKQDGQGAR